MECFSIDTVETGRKIKKLCSTNKITVSRLSEFLGISEQAIYKWLRGDCAPTLDNCWNMSRLFGVHMEEMIETYHQIEREEAEEASSFILQKFIIEFSKK